MIGEETRGVDSELRWPTLSFGDQRIESVSSTMSRLYESRIERDLSFPGAQINDGHDVGIVDMHGEITNDHNLTPEGDHYFQQCREIIRACAQTGSLSRRHMMGIH